MRINRKAIIQKKNDLAHAQRERRIELNLESMTRKEAISRGMKKYFTGKPCKNGHLAQRFVQSGTCEECIKNSHAMILLPKQAEIINPERQNMLDQFNEHQLILRQQRERKLSIEEKALDLKKLEFEMKMAIAAQKLTTQKIDRQERAERREQTTLNKTQLVDVNVFSWPKDYPAMTMMVWGFAAQRDARLKPEDVNTGRTLSDCRFVMRCFPQDKMEILRRTNEIFHSRQEPLNIEQKRLEIAAQLDAELEDNGQPDGDPT